MGFAGITDGQRRESFQRTLDAEDLALGVKGIGAAAPYQQGVNRVFNRRVYIEVLQLFRERNEFVVAGDHRKIAVAPVLFGLLDTLFRVGDEVPEYVSLA